jgi:hypothetical protein
MASTQELDTVSTKIQRIAELAKCHPERSFVSLPHHIDLRWLWEAYAGAFYPANEPRRGRTGDL